MDGISRESLCAELAALNRAAELKALEIVHTPPDQSPSAADLDAVAEEERIREATK